MSPKVYKSVARGDTLRFGFEDVPQTLVVASRNPKKLRELKRLLAGFSLRIRDLRDFPQAPVVKETGRTFDENASKKARETARTIGRWVVADDSGLCVKALDGKPGVHSARYAGPEQDARKNIAKLLNTLRGVPLARRQAYFHCSAALAAPDGRVWVRQGRLTGRIALVPRGSGGFGYDPVFELPRLRKTVAQLSPAKKDRLSHRARALRKLRRLLKGGHIL